MKRTIKEWLESSELTKPAMKYVKLEDLMLESLSQALCTFNWYTTLEGEEYWSRLCVKATTEFHVVWMIDEKTSTGVNINAIDMISALDFFHSDYPSIEPIYIVKK